MTTVQPIKWPISGIKPQTSTVIPSAIGEGIPRASESRNVKIPAITAIITWLLTNEPTLEIIASVSAPTRSRRDAGARRNPSLTICGSEVKK